MSDTIVENPFREFLKSRYVEFGNAIDNASGGIPLGAITVVNGESGSFRSQLMYQLAAINYHRTKRGAVFINCDGKAHFRPERILGMLKQLSPEYSEKDFSAFIIFNAVTQSHLYWFINQELPKILAQRNPILVIVEDPVNYFALTDKSESHALKMFLSRLQMIARDYSVAIAITNVAYWKRKPKREFFIMGYSIFRAAAYYMVRLIKRPKKTVLVDIGEPNLIPRYYIRINPKGLIIACPAVGADVKGKLGGEVA